jgi:RNA polymerase sigma-70 factor (ECF subfamily)
MTPGTHDSQDPPSDAALVARVRAGETQTFAELVRRYQGPLVRVARSRLGRVDWAEDVMQETFLAAFRSCSSYDPRYSFRTWLWTILLNQCHGHYQRRMRSVPLSGSTADCEQATAEREQADPGDSPLSTLLAKERSDELESLLAQLSVVQADALRLRFFGGLKFHEIADAMECSLNTAKNRVRWGLARMAELMQIAGAEKGPHVKRVRESSCDEL